MNVPDTFEASFEDASDSIAAVVNASGTITANHAYDGFGNLRAGSDAIADFGFHAAQIDDATGLYHVRARSYDPRTGRFTSVDPVDPVASVPETLNPYSFANNNPYLFSDPTGGFSLTEVNVTQLISKINSGLKQGSKRGQPPFPR